MKKGKKAGKPKEKAQQTEAQSDQMDIRSCQESNTTAAAQNVDAGVQTGVDITRDSTIDRLNKELEYLKGKVEKADKRFFKTIYNSIETQNSLKRQLEQKEENVKKLKNEIELLKNLCGDLCYNIYRDLPPATSSSAPNINFDMPSSDIGRPCSTMESPNAISARATKAERLITLIRRKKLKTPCATHCLCKQTQTRKTLEKKATSTEGRKIVKIEKGDGDVEEILW